MKKTLFFVYKELLSMGKGISLAKMLAEAIVVMALGAILLFFFVAMGAIL